ncbi:hypothetical protein chiPu_0018779 [Chiloscyllium punctatum]|uniref:Uncharacterized protein n=1 Tax=Chiloscyllium punctatum TaxID=137246 RepID=A0A401RPS0_CHIPU|nr:hypothetical protein [Chiloscyllium punctatum]
MQRATHNETEGRQCLPLEGIHLLIQRLRQESHKTAAFGWQSGAHALAFSLEPHSPLSKEHYSLLQQKENGVVNS